VEVGLVSALVARASRLIFMGYAPSSRSVAASIGMAVVITAPGLTTPPSWIGDENRIAECIGISVVRVRNFVVSLTSSPSVSWKRTSGCY